MMGSCALALHEAVRRAAPARLSRLLAVAGVTTLVLACGGGGGGTSSNAAGKQASLSSSPGSTPGSPNALPSPSSTPGDPIAPPPGMGAAEYVPLFAAGTQMVEQLQYTEADGTLVTLAGFRPTNRHARERGEAWDAPDAGPGNYFNFPTWYF